MVMTDTDGAELPASFDLNLLRIFLAVAECGNVTKAADRLYLTQSAVSAAMKRLQGAVGAPLLARQGRGVVLTERGERLAGQVRPHLIALFDAALAPPLFDPAQSERVLRLGLSDSAESWLLPSLLRTLAAQAPRMRVVSVPVQFRTVATTMLSAQLDFAVTVADELPAGMRRESLLHGTFVCLYDPRQVTLPKKLTVERYLEQEHVIVSYAGDLRGVVEDVYGVTRRVRCSVSSFASIGALVEHGKLLATVPVLVANDILRLRPGLATRPLPFEQTGASIDLIYTDAKDDDACRFARALVQDTVRHLT